MMLRETNRSLERWARPPALRSRDCFQFALKLSLIRWSFGSLTLLLGRYRPLWVCASLAPRQRLKILRALASS